MRRARVLRRLLVDCAGATAVEYALVLPLLALMIMGGIWVGALSLSVSSLDLAVQSAARCAAVDANQCGSASATQTFALSRYAGPAISPVFSASNSGCGHTVTAQANFDLNIVPGIGSIPLSVSACYP
jgi:Flp pilus assembly protein TadG